VGRTERKREWSSESGGERTQWSVGADTGERTIFEVGARKAGRRGAKPGGTCLEPIMKRDRAGTV
jgi:hypothetical protein